MPRKPKTLSPVLEPKKRQPAEQIHDNRYTRGLDVPNHLLPEEDSSAERQQALNLQRQFRWPLSAAVRRTDTGRVSLFVHERYGVNHYSEWADQPPTWMDPHLLVALAEKDPGFQAAVAKAFKQNDVKAYKLVEAEVNRIFEEEYLPWLIEHFREHALSLITQWVTNREVLHKLDDAERTRRRKRPSA